MKFTRHYTVAGQEAYAGIPFSSRHLADGGAPIKAPESWSPAAIRAFAEKAFYSSPVPVATKPKPEPRQPDWLASREPDAPMLATYPEAERTAYERDVRQVFDRVAGYLTHAGWLYGFFEAEADAQVFCDELKAMLAQQIWLPEVSLLAQLGVHWAYGAEKTSEGWVVSPDSGLAALANNALLNPTLAQPLPKMADLSQPGAEAFVLQPIDEAQKVAALVTGSRVLAQHTRAVLIAGCTNPDPARNPTLARTLNRAREAGIPDNVLVGMLDEMRQGVDSPWPAYDLDWDNASYRDLGISNERRILRMSGASIDPLGASWTRISQTIWQSAEPILEFSDTRSGWQTLPDDIACGPAASLNLTRFRLTDGSFDLDGFAHSVRLSTVALEIAGMVMARPTREAAERDFRQRPISISFANTAPYLVSNGIGYDSAKGRATIAAIASLMTGMAYATSAEIAEELGPCPAYHACSDNMLRVLENHRAAAYGRPEATVGLSVSPSPLDIENCDDADLGTAARMAWDQALEMTRVSGLRNAQVTSLAAPLSQADMLEAAAAPLAPSIHVQTYRETDAEVFHRVLSRSVVEGLSKQGYVPEQIAAIRDYTLGRSTLKGAPFINHETLIDRGFDAQALMQVEAALAGAEHIRSAFTVWNLGEEFCQKKLGVPPEAVDDPTFDLLGWLGFLPSEVDSAQNYCCGCGTLQGAPALQVDHALVYSPVSALAEIRMMGAVQPFISGIAGHVIALPRTTALEQVRTLLLEAAAAGLKRISLCREGAKLTQIQALELPSLPTIEPEQEKKIALAEAQPAIPQGVPRAAREPLPTRRRGYRVTENIDGYDLQMQTDEYSDGRLAQVLVEIPDAPEGIIQPVRQFVETLSVALQYGTPLGAMLEVLSAHMAPGPSKSFCEFICRDLNENYRHVLPMTTKLQEPEVAV